MLYRSVRTLLVKLLFAVSFHFISTKNPPQGETKVIMSTEAPEEPLNLLLQAKDKKTVDSIFVHAFRFRDTDGVGGNADMLLKDLGLASSKGPSARGVQLLSAASGLVRDALYSANNKSQVEDLCSAGLDPKLRSLVSSIILSHLKEWRFVSLQQRSNLQGSRLVSVDWRVDLKTCSEEVSSMSVPSAIVKLMVQPEASRQGELARLRTVQFELSKEALQTMLEGLRKIKAQLDKISGN